MVCSCKVEKCSAYLKALRENGAVVNTAIAIGVAEGIIRSKDSNLLAASGGHIALTKSWSKHLLERMGFVKRRVSTKAKLTLASTKAKLTLAILRL